MTNKTKEGDFFIFANFKMELVQKDYLEIFTNSLSHHNNKIIFCPDYTNLSLFQELLRNKDFSLGAQNCHHMENGAFTGDVSAIMLSNLGIKYVIIGHSERRKAYNEDSLLQAKIKLVKKYHMTPVICVGENLEDRENNNYRDFIAQQINELNLSGDEIIAYEPIWAIGTGKSANIEQVEEIHDFISNITSGNKILYGGSVKSGNASSLSKIAKVNGFLVGSASLDPLEFAKINNNST